MGEERRLFSLNGYVYNRNSAGSQWRRLRAKVGMEAFTLHATTADSADSDPFLSVSQR